ncbi:hypothetical protein RAA17_14395 [Komagataeibacter rhaeticus]|nr:hypothetical protein [Komagataeibacter rhaeticus]
MTCPHRRPVSVLPDTDIQLQMRDAARDGSQWTTLFQGIVDHVEWSPAETSVHIQCRDYLARLLDMRVLDGWMNMTGADLARAVITAAGLTPDVTMDTAMVGQFWQVEHKRTAATSHGRFQTAFDLVSALAIQAGCDLYASGTTIICAPPPPPVPPTRMCWTMPIPGRFPHQHGGQRPAPDPRLPD